MKKFIFRFPTTKKSKMIGGMLMETSLSLKRTAERLGKNEDETYNDIGLELIAQSNRLAKKAARHFGFFNAEDMDSYKELRGKI